MTRPDEIAALANVPFDGDLSSWCLLHPKEAAGALRSLRLAATPPGDATTSALDVREALAREEKYLLEHFDADCGIMPSDVEGSFHRIREAMASAPETGDPDMPDLRLCSFNYLADELRRRGATITSAGHGGDSSNG